MKNNYQILKRLLLLIIAVSSINYGYAQTKTVSGKVTSSEDGTPIPGVNILVKNTTTGAVTDVNGDYTISVEENAILVFSSIAFTTQEVGVAGRSVIDLGLAEDVRSLEEIVVVGYGEQRKATATGSVSSVKGDEIKRSPATNLTNNLAGRIPGLTSITRSGLDQIGLIIRIPGWLKLNISQVTVRLLLKYLLKMNMERYHLM